MPPTLAGESAELGEGPTSPISLEEPVSPSRKDTIMSLVQMLLQESEHAARAKTQPPSFEDDRDVPSVDEYLQDTGAAAFNKFSRSIECLDKELRNFANAARQLGSSVAILSSGFRLRERLAQLLILYRENAADLFPRKVAHVQRDPGAFGLPQQGRRRKLRKKWGKAHLLLPRPTVSDALDPEDFPDHLEALAKDVKTFLNCLNEFPEFTDEGVNQSIRSFEGDLRYWSSCLREYTGQFRYPAVQRYIHDLSQEMKDHVDNITSSLCMFIEVGVPTIRFAQKHGSTNLLNLSTIATFFSAVTATTMQFSYELDRDDAGAAMVNCFWFSSLVFSIAAAVNSLLGLTWKQAMYRSPGHRVPWWVLIWIKRSPLVFLVLSVACFSVGLCAFSYASDQAFVTSTLTTVLTAFTSFGLAAVSMWFASERWAFSRHKGQKWLSDVLKETTSEFIRHPGVSWIHKVCKFLSRNLARCGRMWKSFVGCLTEAGWCVLCGRNGDEENEDVEAAHGYVGVSRRGDGGEKLMGTNIVGEEDDATPRRSSTTLMEDAALIPKVPQQQQQQTIPTPPVVSTPTPVYSPASPKPLRKLLNVDIGRQSASYVAAASSSSLTTIGNAAVSSTVAGTSASEAPIAPPPVAPTNGKMLWKNALKTVKMHTSTPQSQAASTPMPFGITLAHSAAAQAGNAGPQPSSPQAKHLPKRSGTGLSAPEPVATAKSRLAALKPQLLALEATQELSGHAALVKDLQFSPDGRWLATSSWDRTSLIFEVGDAFRSHRTLAHTLGFVGQVAWSPHGNILLTRLNKGIKVWTAEDGVCQKTIDRKMPVEAITWMPDGESFLSVEESTVVRLNLEGKMLDQYEFGRIKLHDVAVMPDSSRIIGVGPLLESPTGLQPSKSRVEKRLVVYNIEKKQIENQTPLLNDVRDISIAQARNATLALVSYENKASPQLWKIELVRDREGNSTTARMTLRHTYMPKKTADFSGPSYFGGKNNELVLCTTKAGEINIWDRESGALLHVIRTKYHGEDLTCMAWNQAAEDPYMFATGSHDGGLRVWTRIPEEIDPSHTADLPLTMSMSRAVRNYGWGMGPRSASPESVGDDDEIDRESLRSNRGSEAGWEKEMRGRGRNQRGGGMSDGSSDSASLKLRGL